MAKALIFLLLAAPLAWSTTVIVVRVDGVLYFAADSLMGRIDGSHQSFTCKIHVTNKVVWASSGILYETAGPFDLRKIVDRELQAGPYPQSISRIEKTLTGVLPGLRKRMLDEGEIDPRIDVHLIAASLVDGHILVSYVFFVEDELHTLK